MSNIAKLRPYRVGLWVTAILGLGGLNGAFVWFAVRQPELLADALRNPVSAVFMAEAFILLGLAAWMIRLFGLERPGWLAFILLSLIGGLAFSVPVFLLAFLRKAENTQHPAALAGDERVRAVDRAANG